MDLTGNIVKVNPDYVTGECEITFKVSEANTILNNIDKYMGKKLRIACNVFRNKRSSDANAYMWVLLQKMAEVLQKSKDECYLDMLASYGVFTHLIVKPTVVERMIEEWKLLRVMGDVEVNGVKGIQLQCYFGSSSYDSKQMAMLLNGVVSECKDLEIETLPPEELARMKQQWGV